MGFTALHFYGHTGDLHTYTIFHQVQTNRTSLAMVAQRNCDLKSNWPVTLSKHLKADGFRATKTTGGVTVTGSLIDIKRSAKRFLQSQVVVPKADAEDAA